MSENQKRNSEANTTRIITEGQGQTWTPRGESSIGDDDAVDEEPTEELLEEIEAEEAEESQGDDDGGEDIARYAAEKKAAGGSEKMSATRGYMAAVGSYGVLSAEEEKKYARKAREEGDAAAREFLINHNLRLVISVAKRYLGFGVPMDELIECGNTGLIEAIDKYDERRGLKLSTYATYWIRMRMECGIRSYNNVVTQPTKMHENANVVRKIRNSLSLELERDPTAEEIAAVIGERLSLAEVNEVLGMMKTLSLNAKASDGVGNESETEFGDMIAEENDESPTDYVERREKSNAMEKAIGELKPAYRMVIKMRYGMGLGDDESFYSGLVTKDGKPEGGQEIIEAAEPGREYTLDEIAELLYQRGFRNKEGGKYSKEYVRQLETGAIKALRESKKMQMLREGGM